MDHAESLELRTTLRAVLADQPGNPVTLGSALDELGWDEVVGDEPATSILLFEEHGRAVATSGVLDEAVLRRLGIDDAQGKAVVYPSACVRDQLFAPAMRPAGGVIHISGLTRRPEGYTELLVPASTDDGFELVTIAAGSVEVSAVAGLDPEAGFAHVTAEIAAPDISALDGKSVPWQDAVAEARRSLAAELVGLGNSALEIASRYVGERQQFGRPIGSFQALRFRLAEAKVGLAAAGEAVRLAYGTPSPLASVLAKTVAGSGAETAARQAAQVCGAMGLTWEFPLHRIIRRVLTIDALLGGHREVTAELGRYVSRADQYPQLDPFVLGPEEFAVGL